MSWYNPATWTPVDAIQDKFKRVGNAASSFQGSSPSGPYFSNPTGATPQPKPAAPAPQQKSDIRPGETAPNVLGASTGGSGSGGSDPTTAAYYGSIGDRFRAALDSLPTQREQGLSKIADEHNLALTRANEGYGKVQRDLDIRGEEATADRDSTLRKISNNVLSTAENFRRLLATGHAGNSAFAKEFVPTATARMGTQQRTATMDTFGRNARRLDISRTDAKDQYDDSVEDLGRQHRESQYNFESGLETTAADLRDRLREALYRRDLALGVDGETMRRDLAPYEESANSLLGRMQALFNQYRNPAYDVKPVDVSVPELERYTADPLTAALNTPGGSNGDGGVYLPSLRRRFAELVA